MTTSTEILNQLAVAAERFEFPVLDNAHWDLVAARMRSFRMATEWGVCFEIFVFHRQAVDFAVQIYGYGSLLGGRQAFLDSVTVLEELPDYPLWADDGSWVPSSGIRIAVHGQPIIAVEPSFLQVEESSDVVVLADGDASNEGAFARALVRELGIKHMLPDDLLYRVCPELAGVPEVLRFANWDHPDIAGGESPSASAAIRTAAALLSGEVVPWAYDHGNDNVCWLRWRLEPEGDQ